MLFRELSESFMKFVGDVFMLAGIGKSVPHIIVVTGTLLYLV